jgi:preprotein translocase subunit Sss1
MTITPISLGAIHSSTRKGLLMKNPLVFFVLFSLVLPTQASASACLTPHLAYQKQEVGKKIVKRILKQKMKPKADEWDSLWLILCLFLAFFLGGLLGLIVGLIFKGTWWLWLLGGALAGILLVFVLYLSEL